jgi:hypothetical protein
MTTNMSYYVILKSRMFSDTRIGKDKEGSDPDFL